jgi:hypothetical protein
MDGDTFQFILPKVSRFIAKQRFISIYGMITMDTIYRVFQKELYNFESV